MNSAFAKWVRVNFFFGEYVFQKFQIWLNLSVIVNESTTPHSSESNVTAKG